MSRRLPTVRDRHITCGVRACNMTAKDCKWEVESEPAGASNGETYADLTWCPHATGVARREGQYIMRSPILYVVTRLAQLFLQLLATGSAHVRWQDQASSIHHGAG